MDRGVTLGVVPLGYVQPTEGASMPRFGRDRSTISKERVEFELARLPRQLATAITWYMEKKGVKQVDLAKRLGVTPGRISQILSGDENLTLRTLAAVCAALDARLVAQLVDDDSRSPALTSTRP